MGKGNRTAKIYKKKRALRNRIKTHRVFKDSIRGWRRVVRFHFPWVNESQLSILTNMSVPYYNKELYEVVHELFTPPMTHKHDEE